MILLWNRLNKSLKVEEWKKSNVIHRKRVSELLKRVFN